MQDNFIGGGPTSAADGVSTPRQENALDWYQSVYKELRLKDYSVTLTGHSKGGNKAKYITVLDDTVDRCVAFDGQGFSDEFLEEYRSRIAERQGLIENHNIDFDYVNLLLNDIGSRTFYKGYGYGSGLFLENHCPNTSRRRRLRSSGRWWKPGSAGRAPRRSRMRCMMRRASYA